MAPSTIYHLVATGRLAANRWRGIIVVADEVLDDLLAVQPLPQRRAFNRPAVGIDQAPLATSPMG